MEIMDKEKIKVQIHSTSASFFYFFYFGYWFFAFGMHIVKPSNMFLLNSKPHAPVLALPTHNTIHISNAIHIFNTNIPKCPNWLFDFWPKNISS